MDDETWETIGRLVKRLDEHGTASPETVRLLRILKIGEEAGEVAEAVHGAMGSNPRKGHSHTWDDVQKELCDVVLTAMVALRTITPDAQRVFRESLERVAARDAPR
ncbi:MazG-like family protein [Streptomyces radiopugnans]|uniref:MazG-like family protein n=1 Tax=Streptomyces radiopugnans TaxID=403935 RepID=UPI003F19A2D1